MLLDEPVAGLPGELVSDNAKHAGQNMKFLVTVNRDEDGAWIVECPSIPGCVSQGRTREEAITNVHDAIRECLIVRAERGLPLTVETRQVEVVA